MPALTRRTLSLLLLALIASACVSSSGPQTGEMRRRSDANRLTREEVLDTNTSNVFEAIRQLRPNWLRKRGATSMHQQGDIVVYLDNQPLGGPQMLQALPLTSVASLQFLDAASATQRWGTGHVHGAILVSTQPAGSGLRGPRG